MSTIAGEQQGLGQQKDSELEIELESRLGVQGKQGVQGGGGPGW